MSDSFFRLGILFDFYGVLLTKKQQECLKMHLYDDWSLSEIADFYGISRQSAYDMIHRCEKTLEKYEMKLKLIEKHKTAQILLNNILLQINNLKHDVHIKEFNNIKKDVRKLLNSQII
ncbi:YlxM family DNA-binding protein [Pectinatus sottacetonis]|uniref:YlxM family DNA-binding protein n=1 Tax=Pectinatus sottacetonis TaxID=1002795 RepID=UPI0018C5393F|nr:sigma factor-like helix-turn-helix DNA-binding protein [Pectinatus sottacetonis]